MADIFISYTNQDRDWAFWIGFELEEMGHVVHVHEWEISGGGDIIKWMEERHDRADHVLCVISAAYLKAPYSSLERRTAQWAAIIDRPSFLIPIFVEPCSPPTLLAPLKRCSLHGLSEGEAREALRNFLAPASKPEKKVDFPGSLTRSGAGFPQKTQRSDTLFSVPIAVPFHFMGRVEDIAFVRKKLTAKTGGAPVAIISGLMGVGKSTLAGAYAYTFKAEYRIVWWIRCEKQDGILSDIIQLGEHINIAANNMGQTSAAQVILNSLQNSKDSILLIYDNASSVDEIYTIIPRSEKIHVIITSTSEAWRRVSEPIVLRSWAREIGGAYLLVRTGSAEDASVAGDLSKLLGGLPLAHEQAAAYCERTAVSLDEYSSRFRASPLTLLDDSLSAPTDYYGGRTVARTFALGITAATKQHPAADTIISNISLLASAPIPVTVIARFLQEHFKIPEEQVDEALAALRSYALLELSIRDSALGRVVTVHNLVRAVASERLSTDDKQRAQANWLFTFHDLYPALIENHPSNWPNARLLNEHVLTVIDSAVPADDPSCLVTAELLSRIARFHHHVAGNPVRARDLLERSNQLVERVLGVESVVFAATLGELGHVISQMGGAKDFELGKEHLFRALEIGKKVGAPKDLLASTLTNLSMIFFGLGGEENDLIARKYISEALSLSNTTPGEESANVAIRFSNLALILSRLRDEKHLNEAKLHLERAIRIHTRIHGESTPAVAVDLSNLASTLRQLGGKRNLVKARQYISKALTIHETVFSPNHPAVATDLICLASIRELGNRADLSLARTHLERALEIDIASWGSDHPSVAYDLSQLAEVLVEIGGSQNLELAKQHIVRAIDIRRATFGLADISLSHLLAVLANILLGFRDPVLIPVARAHLERSLAILEANGTEGRDTEIGRENLKRFRETFGE